MLNLPLSRFTRSDEHKLAPDATLTAEGLALVADYSEGSVVSVKPSTGAANEIFMGVSLAVLMDLTELPFIQQFVVDADNLVTTLPGTPVPGSSLVTLDGTAISPGGTVTASKYTLVGNTVEFHADDAGKAVKYVGLYAPTIAQARQIQGDVNPGYAISSELHQTGVVKGGTIYTSEWDTTCAWTGADKVRLGANGKFTTSGTGTEIGATIIELPNTDSAFLGLSFNV